MLPTLLLVSLAVFLLTHLIPGDIINLMISQSGGDKFDRPMVERALGLDVPLMHQYGRWMGFITNADGRFDGLFQGNLGVSWWYGESTKDIINKKWPGTL